MPRTVISIHLYCFQNKLLSSLSEHKPNLMRHLFHRNLCTLCNHTKRACKLTEITPEYCYSAFDLFFFIIYLSGYFLLLLSPLFPNPSDVTSQCSSAGKPLRKCRSCMDKLSMKRKLHSQELETACTKHQALHLFLLLFIPFVISVIYLPVCNLCGFMA